MWFTIFYVKVVRKRPWRDFLINRFNLLIFNTIFTSNLARVLTSSSLWEFILVRLQAFLWFYWEWAPTRVCLYLCFDVQNYLFCRTPLGGCSHFFYFQEVFFYLHNSLRNIFIRLTLKSHCEVSCYCIIVLVN